MGSFIIHYRWHTLYSWRFSRKIIKIQFETFLFGFVFIDLTQLQYQLKEYKTQSQIVQLADCYM